MEKIKNKATQWLGLWENSKNTLSSQTINISKLREYKGNIQIFATKNRSWSKGSNRPKYVFMIHSSDIDNHVDLNLEDYNTETNEDSFDYKFTREELQSLINNVACRVGGDCEYGEWIVEDFI